MSIKTGLISVQFCSVDVEMKENKKTSKVVVLKKITTYKKIWRIIYIRIRVHFSSTTCEYVTVVGTFTLWRWVDWLNEKLSCWFSEKNPSQCFRNTRARSTTVKKYYMFDGHQCLDLWILFNSLRVPKSTSVPCSYVRVRLLLQIFH